MHTTTTQAHLTLEGVLTWRQHSRPLPHHKLPLSSPSGTLGMVVVTQSTRRAVVATTLMVLLDSAVEYGPPPLHSTLTGITPLSGISVIGLTKKSGHWRGSYVLSTRWRSMCEFRWSCAPPLTPRPMPSTASLATSVSILILKSCKDLILREEPGCTGMCGCSFHFVFLLSS
jgi:hypothetical protein